MMVENWETQMLPDTDYYKRVLLDGCVVQYGDIEMSDLRFQMGKYASSDRPVVQVYKKNPGGNEFYGLFYNFEQAVSKFNELKRRITP